MRKKAISESSKDVTPASEISVELHLFSKKGENPYEEWVDVTAVIREWSA